MPDLLATATAKNASVVCYVGIFLLLYELETNLWTSSTRLYNNYLHRGGYAFRTNSKLRKTVATATVVINIGILFFYKYFNFLAESITDALQSFGLKMSVSGLDILLPLGISFFTFKAISYVVDVYKGKLPAEKDFVTFAAYLSFFPQLIAGPIDRATNLIPQLKRKVKFDGCLLRSEERRVGKV